MTKQTKPAAASLTAIEKLSAINPNIHTQDQAADRRIVLSQLIETNKVWAAEFAKLEAAAQIVADATAECEALAAAKPELEARDYATERDSYSVTSVHQQVAHDESPLAAMNVTYIKHGVTLTESLSSAQRPLLAAIVEQGKVPFKIAKLAATPEAALEKWIRSKARGYIAG